MVGQDEHHYSFVVQFAMFANYCKSYSLTIAIKWFKMRTCSRIILISSHPVADTLLPDTFVLSTGICVAEESHV